MALSPLLASLIPSLRLRLGHERRRVLVLGGLEAPGHPDAGGGEGEKEGRRKSGRLRG